MMDILKRSLSPETMPNTPLDTVNSQELQPSLIRALELHQKGDFEQALAILEPTCAGTEDAIWIQSPLSTPFS